MKHIGLAVLILAAAMPITARAEKSASATTAATNAGSTFEGLWSTTFGAMRLVRADSVVSGTYSLENGSTIVGTLKGRKLIFTYQEPQAAGEGWFELAPNGKSFHGKWRVNGDASWNDWDGTRTEPVAGRRWLVILEAGWEENLTDREYSFGEMLRTFFARRANVETRHRFFSDEASLARSCAALAYLAEPVTLVIASHGTSNGITVDGRTIDVKAIMSSLKNASTLDLLHFSACAIMNDTLIPIVNDARFPISGYTSSVDWAASAIIEFMYLDLVLARGTEPAAAAAMLPKLLSFAGDTFSKNISGAPFESAGFRFIEPAAK